MFPNIISENKVEHIDTEWREIQFMDPSELPSSSEHRTDVVAFWGTISQMTDTSGEYRFPIVSRLMTSLLSLPHSNAEVERIFSQVAITKTKLRNSLKSSTLDSILVTKQSLQCSCVAFNPDKAMYMLLNNSIYDSDVDSE